MIPGLKWIALGIVAIVILAIVLIPSGVSSGAPNGILTIYLKDESTGQVFSAELEIGQSTNTMSVFKPMTSFHPLTVSGNQTVAVFEQDMYSFWMSVDFSYRGDKMTSFDSSHAVFSAKTGINIVIENEPMNAVGHTVLIVNYTGILPEPGQTMTIASPSNAPFKIVTTGPYSSIPLRGFHLNGAKLTIAVSVNGIDINNKAVIGTMDAVLSIKTTAAPSGSISVSIDGMSAGVNPA